MCDINLVPPGGDNATWTFKNTSEVQRNVSRKYWPFLNICRWINLRRTRIFLNFIIIITLFWKWTIIQHGYILWWSWRLVYGVSKHVSLTAVDLHLIACIVVVSQNSLCFLPRQHFWVSGARFNSASSWFQIQRPASISAGASDKSNRVDGWQK